MADQDAISVEIVAKIDNLESGLKEATDAIVRALGQMNSTVDESNRHMQGTGSVITQLRYTLQGLETPIRGIRANLGDLAEGFAAAFALDKVKDLYEHYNRLGEEALHTSQQLGIGVEQISSLGIAADIAGVGQQRLTIGLERLAYNASLATQGTNQQRAAFETLGVSMDDLKNKSPVDLMRQIADRFAATADGSQKVALALAVGGRGFAQFIPLLDQGSAGLDRYQKIAEETGTVITDSMADGMEKSSIASMTLGEAVQGLGLTLYEGLKPALDTVVLGLTDAIEWLNNSAKAAGPVATAFSAVVFVTDSLVYAFDYVVTGLRELVDAFKIGYEVIWQLSETTAKVVSDAFAGKWEQAVQDVKDGFANVQTTWKDGTEQIAETERRFQARIGAMWKSFGDSGDAKDALQSIFDGITAPDPGQIINQAGISEALNAAAVKAGLVRLGAEEQTDRALEQMGRESAATLIAQETDIEKRRYQLELDGLNKRIALAGGDEVAKATARGEIEVLEAQHQANLLHIQQQGDAAIQREQQQALNNQISNERANLSLQVDNLHELESEHRISFRKMIAEEQSLTDTSNQKGHDALQAWRDTYFVPGTKDYEAMTQRLIQFDQQWAAADQRIKAQAAQHTLQYWNQATAGIVNAWGSGIANMIKGTGTWRDALGGILDSVVDAFAHVIEQIVEQWIEGQIATAILGKATASAGALPGIFAGAAETYAYAFADSAALGPAGLIAAPGVAEAASGAALGGALALLAASKGAYLDQDSLVYAHKDEMILPPHLSDGISNMINGGHDGAGGPINIAVHWAVQTIDAQSFASFIHQNKAMLTETIVDGIKRGAPRLRESLA